MFRFNSYVASKKEKSIFLHQKYAEQGDAHSQYSLAQCYANGTGIEKCNVKAFEWYKKAAYQSHISAQFSLGQCYRKGIGTERNEIKSFQWYQKAADQGHLNAQFNLGTCYANGMGVVQNKEKAFELYEKAALRGQPIAQYNLGLCYDIGLGTGINKNKAFEWYQNAAYQGVDSAQYHLAVCYKEGIGIEVNESKVFEWYKKAADQGNIPALFQTGYHYALGRYVKNNNAVGLRYIQKAADQGHVRADLWIDKKITVNPYILLRYAAKSPHCYIPKQLPHLVDQIGPYCGSAAFAEVCNYANLLPFPVYASEYEKKIAGKMLNESNKDVVLEQLKFTRCPTHGPQYSIYSFKDLANHYKIKNSSAVILSENCTEKKYRNSLCKALDANNVLILSCESENEMPTNSEGKLTHWALGFGYWVDKDHDYKIAVVHHGLYCVWSIRDLYLSNKNLPTKNPLVENGSLKEFRFSFFKAKVQHKRGVIRHIPSSMPVEAKLLSSTSK